MSTLAVFGGVALGQIDQPTADEVVQQVIDAGINHIDIAPSYGEAESRLGTESVPGSRLCAAPG